MLKKQKICYDIWACGCVERLKKVCVSQHVLFCHLFCIQGLVIDDMLHTSAIDLLIIIIFIKYDF